MIFSHDERKIRRKIAREINADCECAVASHTTLLSLAASEQRIVEDEVDDFDDRKNTSSNQQAQIPTNVTCSQCYVASFTACSKFAVSDPVYKSCTIFVSRPGPFPLYFAEKYMMIIKAPEEFHLKIKCFSSPIFQLYYYMPTELPKSWGVGHPRLKFRGVRTPLPPSPTATVAWRMIHWNACAVKYMLARSIRFKFQRV